MLSPLEQIAARLGVTLEQLQAETPPEPPGRHERVKDGPELRRILALPRRPPPGDSTDPGHGKVQELAAFLTSRLARYPNPYPGPLRPIQAAALYELYMYGGVLGPIRAGYGKTLLAYLAPAIVDAKRPLYVAPANLREDVRREFRKFAQHWHGPHPDSYEFVSYQVLGQVNAGVRHDAHGNVLRASLLDRISPDLIVFDEAHYVKNKNAAVTKRVRRYLEANPHVKVVAMSGTMTRKSLLDFAHLARWSMPRMCPLPTVHGELEAWADALDEKQSMGPRCDVGALIQFCTREEQIEVGSGDEERARAAARQAVRRRIVETPGCVATQDGPLGIPIRIEHLYPTKEDPEVAVRFERVRELWELPDGQPIADGLEMARHGWTLGLGFWQRWNPRPPDEWLDARREWAKWCRDLIRYNRRGIDSERQAKDAVRAGLYNDHGALAAWEEIEPTFTPTTEAVWFSDEVVQTAAQWLSTGPGGMGCRGIIWAQHIEVGQRLSECLSLPYYGAEGKDARGRFILDHPPGTPMIASAQANRTGRNLQKGWSENLLLCVPDEQLLARTHRDGQEAEIVRFWQYLGCWEHCASYWGATQKARYAEQIQGQAMRLVYADVSVPQLAEVELRGADVEFSRWHR